MKTTEGNKLIMEFMSEKQEGGDTIYFIPQGSWDITYTGITKRLINRAKYHTSWDWLMGVVDKIESFGYNPKIHYDLFMVEDKDSLRHVTETSASPKIMAVWHGVIQFIQWYNENKEEAK